MKEQERPHYGRAVIMVTDRAVYVRCPKLHLIERVPLTEWESHWLHDRIWQRDFCVECSIEAS